jgi:hypothetical protein
LACPYNVSTIAHYLSGKCITLCRKEMLNGKL